MGASIARGRRHGSNGRQMLRSSERRLILRTIAVIFVIMALSIPLWLMQPIVAAIAGKSTEVNVGLSIAITLTATAALSLEIFRKVQAARRRDSLIALRFRCKALEDENSRLRTLISSAMQPK